MDHTQQSSWASILGRQSQDGHGAAELPDTPLPPTNLPLDRETSSIPRIDGSNWVYPSQAQFYAAMARKNHNPQEVDMKVVVPIHNAVNERAWMEIMKWEAGQGGDKCGGVKLVSFKGRPNDMTPRARWYSLLGYVVTPSSNCDRLIFDPGSHLRSTVMTGLSTVAGHACAMSSTSTPDILEGQPRRTYRSTSTFGLRSIAGRVFGCERNDFGGKRSAVSGGSLQRRRVRPQEHRAQISISPTLCFTVR